MQLKNVSGLAALAVTLVAASPAPERESPGDAEAIAFLIAVDSAEIMIADLAISKKLSAGVMEYVKDVKEDHKEHLADIMRVANTATITPLKSPVVDSLGTKSRETHHKLMSAKDDDFEKMLLDEMIAGHSHVLDKLDKHITKLDLSASIRGEVEDLRKGVQEHLSKAKSLKMG